MSDPEKKIIVDEDWKTQVQAEKDAAKAGKESPAEQPAEASSEQPVQAESADETELPPASFATLLSSLMSQTLFALGQFLDAEGKMPEPDLPLARHLIDTLSLLEEKTKGNLTADETTLLGDLLHQLRMGYVAVERAAKQ